jgi:excisionase family DNA binding protein
LEEKYYTITEVAKMLNYTYATILRWVESGKIKSIKIAGGYRWRIPESEYKRLSGQ